MVLCHPGCQEMRIFQDVDDDHGDNDDYGDVDDYGDDDGAVLSNYKYVLKVTPVFNSDAVL